MDEEENRVGLPFLRWKVKLGESKKLDMDVGLQNEDVSEVKHTRVNSE